MSQVRHYSSLVVSFTRWVLSDPLSIEGHIGMFKSTGILTLTFFTLLVFEVYSEDYLYHPGVDVGLGDTFDPRNPFRSKVGLGYIKWSEKESGGAAATLRGLKDVEQAGVLKFKFAEVKNSSSLCRALSISSNLEMNNALAKWSASLSKTMLSKFDEKTAVFIFHATVNYPPERKPGVVSLTEEAKACLERMASNGRIVDFSKAIGTEYVTSITKGHSIGVIYEIKASTKEKKDEIVGRLNAAWKTGKGAINIHKEIKQIDSHSKIEVEARQTGFIPAEDGDILDLLNTSPGDLSRVRKICFSAVRKMSYKDAKVLKFKTGFIHNLLDVVLIDEEGVLRKYAESSNLIRDNLKQLYSDYITIRKLISQVSEVSKLPENDLVKGSIVKLEKLTLGYLETLRAIKEQYISCLEASDLNDCNYLPKKIEIFNPTIFVKLPYVVPAGWANEEVTHSGGCAQPGWYHFETIYHPILKIKYPRFISSIYIFKNKIRVRVLTNEDIVNIFRNHGSLKGYPVSKHIDYCIHAEGRSFQSTRAGHTHNHNKAESQFKYKAVINLVDGSKHVVELGNYLKPK